MKPIVAVARVPPCFTGLVMFESRSVFPEIRRSLQQWVLREPVAADARLAVTSDVCVLVFDIAKVNRTAGLRRLMSHTTNQLGSLSNASLVFLLN